MRPSLPLGIMPLLGLALAKPASNFNVTSQFAEAHGCGESCQKLLHELDAYDLSQVGYDFDFDFYETAKNFSQSKPGDLLKLQAVDPEALQVKAGTTVFRIQYTSLDLDGETIVPATGFIAFPYAPLRNSPDQTYRSVAFAHGTIGLYRGCAPSNGPSLYDYDSWSLLIERGYAVIATDYAGLGNNYTLHKYCSFPAHAQDVYYSMTAARKAFGSILSPEWMSVGHSQGGGAVWKLAESVLVKNDCAHPYLGTVALAPATHIIDMVYEGIANGLDSVDNTNGASIVGYTPFLGLALQRAQPSYNLTIFGPKMRERMAIADKAQTCTTAMKGLTVGLKPEDILSLDNVQKDAPRFLKWQKEMAPASGDHSPAPILVLQGLNDTTVLHNTTRNAFERSCKSKNEVHLSLYPGAEHSPLLPASAPEWLGWMDARFAGQSTSGICSSTTRQPFDGGKLMKLPTEAESG